jgi:hypothetical protein
MCSWLLQEADKPRCVITTGEPPSVLTGNQFTHPDARIENLRSRRRRCH